MTADPFEYDVAISFASEDRAVAEEIAKDLVVNYVCHSPAPFSRNIGKLSIVLPNPDFFRIYRLAHYKYEAFAVELRANIKQSPTNHHGGSDKCDQ